MTALDEFERLVKSGEDMTVAAHKVRRLKDLVITDVSSVDRGAGRGVRVVLKKRARPAGDRDALAGTVAGPPRKEVTTMSSMRCPHCGGKIKPDDEEDELLPADKRYSLSEIAAGSRMATEQQITKAMKADSTLSFDEARIKVCGSAGTPVSKSLNDLVVEERNARLGYRVS